MSDACRLHGPQFWCEHCLTPELTRLRERLADMTSERDQAVASAEHWQQAAELAARIVDPKALAKARERLAVVEGKSERLATRLSEARARCVELEAKKRDASMLYREMHGMLTTNERDLAAARKDLETALGLLRDVSSPNFEDNLEFWERVDAFLAAHPVKGT